MLLCTSWIGSRLDLGFGFGVGCRFELGFYHAPRIVGLGLTGIVLQFSCPCRGSLASWLLEIHFDAAVDLASADVNP